MVTAPNMAAATTAVTPFTAATADGLGRRGRGAGNGRLSAQATVPASPS
ncbi:hypothetical protein [Amycolatopsis methanolica]